MSNSTDLVKKIKEQNQEAFSELVDLYGDRVFNLGLKILRNSTDAEDVFQETFTTVFEKIHTFNEQSDLFTWIYRIATNQALKTAKQSRRKFLFTQLEDADGIPDQAVNVLGELVKKDRTMRLNQMIQTLPNKQRTVLILRIEQELPFKEIAQILNRSIGSVKANYFHAVRKLRLAFEKEDSR